MTEDESSGAVVGTWDDASERLDRVLAELQLARSRNRAREVIAAGDVTVNGRTVTKPAVKVGPGSVIAVSAHDRYVGRGAAKLNLGLDRFNIDVSGRVALDVGASTGGFTQVLLERGARLVQAVDVGHDQMAAQLRNDARVRLVEGWNARDMTPEDLADRTRVAEAPSLVVADLSFISLTLVIPAIARCAAREAEFVLLIKPQFEVGRVSRGVVIDPSQWAEAMRIVLEAAADHGLACRGLETSPVRGVSGNREYLSCFIRAERPDPTQWERRIAELSDADADPPSVA